MKLNHLFEDVSHVEVRRLNRNDGEALEQFVDLVNSEGQLAIPLTTTKLLAKTRAKGRIYAAIDVLTDEVVGTIAVKELDIGDYDVGEVGYLFVKPAYRNLKLVSSLYKEATNENRSKFDFMFATTDKRNRPVKTLLKRTITSDYLFTARSPLRASVKLDVWLYTRLGGKVSKDEAIEALQDHFGETHHDED